MCSVRYSKNWNEKKLCSVRLGGWQKKNWSERKIEVGKNWSENEVGNWKLCSLKLARKRIITVFSEVGKKKLECKKSSGRLAATRKTEVSNNWSELNITHAQP